jgi:hypothetical protein
MRKQCCATAAEILLYALNRFRVERNFVKMLQARVYQLCTLAVRHS